MKVWMSVLALLAASSAMAQQAQHRVCVLVQPSQPQIVDCVDEHAVGGHALALLNGQKQFCQQKLDCKVQTPPTTSGGNLGVGTVSIGTVTDTPIVTTVPIAH